MNAYLINVAITMVPWIKAIILLIVLSYIGNLISRKIIKSEKFDSKMHFKLTRTVALGLLAGSLTMALITGSNLPKNSTDNKAQAVQGYINNSKVETKPELVDLMKPSTRTDEERKNDFNEATKWK